MFLPQIRGEGVNVFNLILPQLMSEIVALKDVLNMHNLIHIFLFYKSLLPDKEWSQILFRNYL